jgi:hypothetical protein
MAKQKGSQEKTVGKTQTNVIQIQYTRVDKDLFDIVVDNEANVDLRTEVRKGIILTLKWRKNKLNKNKRIIKIMIKVHEIK